MSHPSATRGNFVFGVIFVLAFGAVVAYRSLAGRSGGGAGDAHAVPAAFSEGLTFDAATRRAADTSRPVLIYASASWCGPCRKFKADTLARPEITAALTEGFVPVYLDIDEHGDIARTLHVTAVPTVIVVRDGQQVDRATGYMDAQAFRQFLARQAR